MKSSRPTSGGGGEEEAVARPPESRDGCQQGFEVDDHRAGVVPSLRQSPSYEGFEVQSVADIRR